MKRLFLLLLILLGLLNVNANELFDRLQSRLSGLAPGVSTTIDLTEENLAGELDQPLVLKNGINVKLVNGTINTDWGISVTEESHLEIGEGAEIRGHLVPYNVNNYNEYSFDALVFVDGGSLIVSEGGAITHISDVSYNSRLCIKKVIYHIIYSYAVRINKDNDSFTLQGGIIKGRINLCNKSNAYILGGYVNGIIMCGYDYESPQNIPVLRISGGNIESIGDYGYGNVFHGNVIFEGGYCNNVSVCNMLRTSSQATIEFLRVYSSDASVRLEGGICRKIATLSDIHICGDTHVEEIALYYDNIVWLSSSLNNTIKIGCMKEKGSVIVKGDNYRLTFNDRSYVNTYTRSPIFPYESDSDEMYYLYDCYFYMDHTTYLMDNSICLADPKDVDSADDLQNFINNLSNETDKGQEDNPVQVPTPESGIIIDNDVTIDDNIFICFFGLYGDEISTGLLPFNFTNGSLNINNENAGCEFFNTTFSDQAVTPSRNFRVISPSTNKGINNHGKVIVNNSLLTEGSYTINNSSDGWMVLENGTSVEGLDNLMNSGNLTIDGTVKVTNLINRCGGRILVTSALGNDISITISDEDIETGVPIVSGSNGYKLTSADAVHILLNLPSNYKTMYDSQNACIVVNETNAISNINTIRREVVSTYDVIGRRLVDKRQKGITIQRMNDGKRKKVITK